MVDCFDKCDGYNLDDILHQFFYQKNNSETGFNKLKLDKQLNFFDEIF